MLALIVLFQDEIRHFLLTLGSHQRTSILARFLSGSKKEQMDKSDIVPIVLACLNMSKQRIGALIVVEKNVPLYDIIRTGEVIDANVNQRLIENIFFKSTPLDDGAVIINENKILAARCILPVSDRRDIPGSMGLRHRAALGLSEVSDAYVVVVSEETGNITFFKDGSFKVKVSPEELKKFLSNDFSGFVVK